MSSPAVLHISAVDLAQQTYAVSYSSSQPGSELPPDCQIAGDDELRMHLAELGVDADAIEKALQYVRALGSASIPVIVVTER